jgi:hypothetical protein
VIREFLVSGAVERTVVSDTAPGAPYIAADPTLDDVFAECTGAVR